MKHISESKCRISVFKVWYKNLAYYTIIDELDRDELAIAFEYSEQTHVRSFKGPPTWLIDVYLHLTDLLKHFEIDRIEGFCIYPTQNINEIWAMIQGELLDINKACEILKE